MGRKKVLFIVALALALVLAGGILGACLQDPALITTTITYYVDGDAAYSAIVDGAGATDPDYVPYKAGYEFAGWYTDEACTIPFDFQTYAANENRTDISVYAKFDIISATITYMSEGSVFNTYTVEGFTGTDPEYAPTKDGYAFAGWYRDEAFTSPFDFDSYVANEYRTDITVYAKFEMLYTITYVVNGADEEIEPTKATIGTTVNLPTPTREGYVFLGWYETQTPSGLYEKEEPSIIMQGSDLTYYAMWADKPIDGYSFRISDDGVTITGYTGSATQLEIPSSIFNKEITAIEAYAFSNLSSVTSITISDSVTSIGTAALEGFTSLQYNEYDNALYLGNTNNPYHVLIKAKSTDITSCEINENTGIIYDNAFSGCSSLTSITIPENVTDIGSSAFSVCESLTAVYITDIVAWCAIEFDVYYDNPLYYAKNLYLNGELVTELEIPAGITEIKDHTFAGFSGTSITIGGSVTSIGGGAFANCFSLDDVYITDIAAWCAIEFGDSMANPLTYAKNLYINGELVTEIEIPDGVTSIGSYAFYNYYSLTSITIPESVTSIGEGAFERCTSPLSITIPDSVTSIGKHAFKDCAELTINCEAASQPEGWDSEWNSSACPVVWDCKNNDMADDGNIYYIAENGIHYVLNNSAATVTRQSGGIGGDVVIPATIAYKGDTYTVTTIEKGAFYGCDSLISMTLPFVGEKLDGTGDTDFGYIFGAYYSSDNSSYVPASLKSVTITGGESIGDYAFSGCSSLTSITIGGGVTSIANSAFYWCTSLTSVTIGGGVTSIGGSAFSGCSSLREVHIIDLAAWCAIDFGSSDANPLSYAKNLYINGELAVELEIPEGVTSIGSYAFSGCTSLTSITIPESVTSIGEWAFSGCSSLTSITIPASVTSIGSEAFYGCSSLTIYCEAASQPEGWDTNWTSGDCPVVWDCNNNDIADDGYIYFVDENGLRYALKDGTATIVRQSESLSGAIGIPARVTYKEVSYSVTSIEEHAFEDCNSLTSITIPESVTSIGDYVFAGCTSLGSMTVEEGNSTYHSAGNCLIETASKTLITGCKNSVIPMDGSVTSIGRYAFNNCTSLTSITIPDSVTSIGDWAFSYCTSLTSITIEGGGTSIGVWAFYWCSSLESITIEGGVTSIGDSAFSGCTSLTEVHISDIAAWCAIEFGSNFANPLYRGGKLYLNGNLVTELAIPEGVTRVGDYAFYNYTALTSVRIPDSVTSIGEDAFYGCTAIIEQEGGIEYVDTWVISGSGSDLQIREGTTGIADRAFEACSFTNIIIPNSVTNIGSFAFSDCTLLTSITIPDSIISIGYSAFSGCTSLESITLPFVGAQLNGTSNTHFGYIFGASARYNNYLFVPESLKNVAITGGESIEEGAFEGCNLLESITLPFVGAKLDGSGETSFSYIFQYDVPESLKNVVITGGSSIGRRAFSGLTSIESITIPESVTSIGINIFENCDALVSITVEEGNSVYHSAGNCIIETASKTLIAGCNNSIIPTDGSVTSIEDYAFASCTSLTNISIPSGVTSIGDYAFRGCSSLTNISIPSGVTSIGDYAFRGCSSLTNISIPSGVTSIGDYAFEGCTALTNISIPSGVTSIGDYAFASCTSLESITVPDSVTSMGEGVFYGCNMLTNASIGNGVTSIEDFAFLGCTALTSITIAGSVTSIGNNAFLYCHALTEIHITDLAAWCAIDFIDYYSNPLYYAKNLYINGELVTELEIPDGVTSIGDYAFYNCTSLTSINIPDSVTSIGDYAFDGCTSLTSVSIGNSVTSIGYRAFYNCTSLANITFQGTKAQWNAISKYAGWNYNTGSYTIHCTDGDIEK